MYSAPILCRDFIGRGDSLAHLRAIYAAAQAGNGSTTLVLGEPGIGKTRLIAEFGAEVVQAGGWFAIGASLEYARASYAPVMEIVRSLIGGHEQAKGELHELQKSLAPLLPRIAQEPVEPSALEGDEGKVHLFGLIAEVLRRMSGSRPVVLALEDAHWADAGSLELVHYLTTRLADTAVVLLVTFRSEELLTAHHLWPLVAKIERAHASRLELGPLSGGEMRRLLRRALDGRAELGRDALERIVELAEGNPFCAEELLRTVLDNSTTVKSETAALPLSLRASVLERVRKLPDDEQLTLKQAAVAGRTIDCKTIARIGGRQEADLRTALERACALQLVDRQAAPQSGEYVFRHALTREVLYDELPGSEREALHASIASFLESKDDAGARYADLAYHHWAARNAEKAILWNERAGDAVTRSFAFQDAAHFYERALDFQTESCTRRAQLCEKLAFALNINGASAASSHWYEQAAREYAALDDLLASAKMLRMVGWQHYLSADGERAREYYTRAFEVLAPLRDDPSYCDDQINLADFLVSQGQREKALDLLEDAQRLAGWPATAHPDHFYEARATANAALGRLRAAGDDFACAVSLARRCGSPKHFQLISGNYAAFLMQTGDVESGKRIFDAALAAATGKQLPLPLARILCRAAESHILIGDLEGARSFLERYAKVAMDTPIARMNAGIVGTLLGTLIGDVELHQLWTDENVVELAFRSCVPTRIGAAAVAFGELYLSQDRADEAQALFHRALVALPSAGDAYWLMRLVALHGADVDSARARALLEHAAKRGDNRPAQAYLKLFEASLAHRQRRHEEGRTKALAAAKEFAGLHFALDEAWALEGAGQSETALKRYKELGDRSDARRVESKIRASKRRGRMALTLTGREREVARLAAAGKLNREIAARLRISVRTVEHHLASVYGRLGIRSRAQLAAATAGDGEVRTCVPVSGRSSRGLPKRI
jgi:DNA-binding CsgD family transcriptional regulator/Tfp pilus assembly protein PilF